VARLERRLSLRSSLLGIAVMAVLFAGAVHLKRRYDRLRRLALLHGGESERIERLIINDPSLSMDEANRQFRRSHWHGYAATYYFEAATRPWMNFQADPSKPYCICPYCQSKPWLPTESLCVPETGGEAL
jgi:hypothetical protein